VSKVQISEKTGEKRLNGSGSQKYKYNECGAVYTPAPKENGYPAETRLLAVGMYVEGRSYAQLHVC